MFNSKSFPLICFIQWICMSIPVDFVDAGDGAWSQWNAWSSCTATCGNLSNQRRFRDCNDPPPNNGGKWCTGSPMQVRKCEELDCPEDGGWTDWSVWSQCSVTCGEGQHFRSRSCTNPEPKFGGRDCNGESQEKESCKNVKNCPRDGHWSMWSEWTACSVTCGKGMRQKSRSCNNPPPAADGQPCRGDREGKQNCKAAISCPINGQWSEWTDWTSCSTTCGSGQRRRVRSCDNPPAQHGGLPCDDTEAGHIQLKLCNASIVHCPVDGMWSAWSSWGPCERKDCEAKNSVAYSFQSRSCNNPLPQHGGTMCQGSFLFAGSCTVETNCKVNGGWGEWSQWNCTSETSAKRFRECNNPVPANGGEPCPEDQALEFYLKRANPEKYDEVCNEDEEETATSSNVVDENDEDLDDVEENSDWMKDYE